MKSKEEKEKKKKRGEKIFEKTRSDPADRDDPYR